MRALEASIKRVGRGIPRVVDAGERRRLYALAQQGIDDALRPRSKGRRSRAAVDVDETQLELREGGSR